MRRFAGSLLQRSLEAAGFNPIRWMFGVGIDNFHIVSIHEKVQHNSYLQVFNEVGLPALIFYLHVPLRPHPDDRADRQALSGVPRIPARLAHGGRHPDIADRVRGR